MHILRKTCEAYSLLRKQTNPRHAKIVALFNNPVTNGIATNGAVVQRREALTEASSRMFPIGWVSPPVCLPNHG